MSTQPPLSPSGPLDASLGLPLLEPPLDASLLDASAELMPELLLPAPLLPLPEPLLLDEEPELPLPEAAPSPTMPSVEASTAAAETSPVLPPQPHKASATKRVAPGTSPR
jgi:hypothetical protein